jgi:hypothetical protein
MVQAADPVTFSVPREVLIDIKRLSGDLVDRMHELLERNAEGELQGNEAAELQTLVRMAQFSQIVSVALEPPVSP